MSSAIQDVSPSSLSVASLILVTPSATDLIHPLTFSKIFLVLFISSDCLFIASCTVSIVDIVFSEFSPRFIIIFSISADAALLWSASLLISTATTAKPFPLSPALAASIDALRLNRFVSSAIDAIRFTASFIFSTDISVSLVCSLILSIASSTPSFEVYKSLRLLATSLPDLSISVAASERPSTSSPVFPSI